MGRNRECGPSLGPSTPSNNQMSPGTPSSPASRTPRAPPPTPATGIFVDDERDTKERDIHRCLNDPLSEGIDLRRLRQLATSQGGLKTIALRKQAWPKLVAAHEVLWNAVGKPTVVGDSLYSSQKLKTIQKLAGRVKWSKHQITKSPKTFDELLGLVLSAKSPTVAPPTPSLMDDSLSQSDFAKPSSGPHAMLTNRIRRVSFDISLDDDNGEEDEDVSKSWAKRKEKERLRQLAQDERQVLRKLMLHLQSNHPDFEFYDGLQNLLAILWIVLESPSLTSVTSLQLVQYQWQRPGGQGNDEVDLFLQVLMSWDPPLYHHLRMLGYEQTPICISTSWIPHWFSQDLKDLGILLRIWDVLLVSPPTAIVYFSVALVVYFRDPLLRANQRPIFQAILEHLPGDGLEKYDSQVVESILESCLKGLEEYPINPAPPMQRLPSQWKRERVPTWFTAPMAPTDIQTLERLRQLRQERLTPSMSNRLLPFDSDKRKEMPSNEVLAPLSPPSIVSRSTIATPHVFQMVAIETDHAISSFETPNATPCSTPESIGALAPEIKRLVPAKKRGRPLLSSINYWYRRERRGIANAVVLVALIVFIGLFRSKDADIIVRKDAPARETEQSPTTTGPNATEFFSDYDFVLSLDDAEINMKQYPELETHTWPLDSTERDFLSLIEVEIDRHPGDSTTREKIRQSGQQHATRTVPPEKRMDDRLLQSQEKEHAWNQSSSKVFVENVHIAPSLVDVSHHILEDSNTVNSTDVPDHFFVQDDIETQTATFLTLDLELSEIYRQRISSIKDDEKGAAFSKMLFGFGHLILQSSKCHLEARKEAINTLEAVRSQSLSKLNWASMESQTALGFAAEESMKCVENIGKTFQTQQHLVSAFALQATKARLEASVVAREKANLAALTLIGTSRNVTLLGLENAYAFLSTATNTSVNVAGNGLRGLGRTGQRAKRTISNVVKRSKPGITLGARIVGKGTLSGAKVIRKKSFNISRGMSLYLRDRTFDATRALLGTKKAIHRSTQRIGSMIQDSRSSMARAVVHGASTVGTTVRSGQQKVGKLGLRSLQSTLHRVNSAVSMLSSGARTTVKGMGQAFEVVDQGRKRAFTSAFRASRKSIDRFVDTGNGIIIGSRSSINGVMHGQKQSTDFMINSGRKVLAKTGEVGRALGEIRSNCDYGIKHGSTYALSAAKEACQRGLSTVKKTSRSIVDPFFSSSKRTYNLALLSTNATLNACGRLARNTATVSTAGTTMVTRGGAETLNLVPGSVKWSLRMIRTVSNAVNEAASNRGSGMLNALDQARQVSLEVGHHCMVMSAKGLRHGAKSGVSTVSYSANKAYDSAIVATNSTLNALGLVAKTLWTVADAGVANLKMTLRGGTIFSSLAVDECCRVVQLGARDRFSNGSPGMWTAAKRGQKGEMQCGTIGKREFPGCGRKGNVVETAVKTGEHILVKAEKVARSTLYVALLMTNSTLNVVGTQTALVATITKRGFHTLRQAIVTIAYGIVAKNVRRCRHLTWMEMTRRLHNARMGLSMIIDAGEEESKTAKSAVTQWVAKSAITYKDLTERVVGLTKKSRLSFGPLVSKTTRKVTPTCKRWLRYMGGCLRRLGSHQLQWVKESNDIQEQALDSVESGLRNVRGFAMARRRRLGALAASLMPRMRLWIAMPSHIGWQSSAAIAAAVVAAYGFASTFVLEVKNALVSGSLHAIDLAEELAIAVKSVLSESPVIVHSASSTFSLEGKNVAVDGNLREVNRADDLAFVKSGVLETPRREAQTFSSVAPTIHKSPLLPSPNFVSSSDAATTKVDISGISRCVRGAGDLARESIQKGKDANVEFGNELTVIGDRLLKRTTAVESIHKLTLLRLETKRGVSEVLRRARTQSLDAILGSLTQGALIIEMIAQKSLLSVHLRVQATVGRTKDLIRLCMFAIKAVGEATSRFVDNLTLHGQYALYTMELSLKDKRRGLISLVQEVDRILALRRARELALIVLYNMLLVTMAFVDFGKNQLHTSSERNMSAVLEANSVAWSLIQDAAEVRIDGMQDARRAIVGSLNKAKQSILDRFRWDGDKVKDGASSLGRHLPFHNILSA